MQTLGTMFNNQRDLLRIHGLECGFPNSSVSHLKKQLIYLRWQGLLQDPEEGVGLAAHRHRQAQVLHAVLDVALRKQLLSQLHLWRSTTWLVYSTAWKWLKLLIIYPEHFKHASCMLIALANGSDIYTIETAQIVVSCHSRT